MKHNRLALSIILALTVQAAQANPQGAQVVQGTASFSNPATNVLNVTNSRGAIINWQQFNIGKGQTTNFIQPSSSSSVLNRVIGNDPSQLLGKLNSNGRVFLINQNGILVGEGASINTNGFFGSTLNITDEDFLNGRLNFKGGGQGEFNNQGYIHAGEDGNIVLIAPNVENGGVIEVENGNIILAAGKSITITSLQNSSLQFEVQSPENSVTNLGQVIAKNGAVGLFAGTLKHSGSIRATGLVRDANGTIRLVAADAAQVSGNVQAAGGKIEVLGDTVAIEQGATIDASSDNGGGEILIGGDQQGLNPDVRNATSTTVASGAQVHADGVGNADGGKVIVFAQNDVHVQGDITARGGAQGGDGGFIETSGKQALDITAVPDATAVNGNGGEWLVDPYDIDIVAGSADPGYSANFTSSTDATQLGADLIVQSLQAGTSVTISTGSGGSIGKGDINIKTSIQPTGPAASLTLNAHNDINIDSSLAAINITSSSPLNLTLNSDSDGDLSGATVIYTGFSTGFPITIDTANGNMSTGDVKIGGIGGVNISNTSWDSFGNLGLESGSTLTITSGQNPANLTVNPGSYLYGAGTINANVIVNGGVISGGNLFSTDNLSINGSLTINSGLLYAVFGGSATWGSSSITANSITLTGGELMAVWEDGFSANTASASISGSGFTANPLSLLNCAGSGCMSVPNNFSFSSVTNPLLISNSAVNFDQVNGSVNYSINYNTDIVQDASIISWLPFSQSGNVNWEDPANWSTSSIPTATDYVFLVPGDGAPVAVGLSTSQTIAGMQSFDGLLLNAGANLAVGGTGIFAQTLNGYPGIQMFDSTATISSVGGLYMAPRSVFNVKSGVMQSQLVNWGNMIFMGDGNGGPSILQLNGNLQNNNRILVQGGGILNGSGSLNNNVDLQLSAGLLSNVVFNNNANGSIKALPGGANLTLTGNSSLDGVISLGTGSSMILTGGTHQFAPSLLQDGDLNFAGGTYQGTFNQAAAATLNISAADGNVLFDGFTLSSAGTVTVSNSVNNFVLSNSSSWLNSAGLSLAAGSKVDVLTGSSLQLKTGTNLTGSAGGALTLSGSGSNLVTYLALDFATPGISLDVLNGANAVLNADVNAGAVTLDGTLVNNATLSIANLLWQSGALTGSGSTAISSQINLTGLAAMSLDQSLLLNAGSQGSWSSAVGDLTILSAAASITNNATWTDSSTRSITGSGSFFNNGSYIANTAAVSTIGIPFNNAASGNVTIQSGTLALLGGGNGSGSFNVNDRLQMGGTHALSDAVFSGTGVFEQLAGNTTLNTTGSASFALDTIIGNSGQLFLNHDATLANLQLLSGGVLSNAGNLAVSNLQWIDGTLNGAGATTVTTQANLSGAGALLLDTQTLNLQTATNWSGTGGGLNLLNNAVINNAGNFNDTSTASINGAGSFNNSGTYILNSSGTSSLTVPLSNTGNIQLLAGTLDLAGNTLTLGGGRLSGNGGITGSVVADTGSVIAPGNSIGTLNIDGNLTFAAGSHYELEMDVGAADKIIATGAVSIDPTAQLNITGFNGYNGVVGDGGSVLNTTGSMTGTFAPYTQPVDFTVSDQYIAGPPDSLDINVIGVNNRWIANGDGTWETAANWSRNEVPTSGHDVFIENGTLAVTVNSFNLPANAIRSLTANSTTTLNLANSSALTSGDMVVGSLNLDSANLSVNGNLNADSVSVNNLGAVLNGSGNLIVSSVLSLNNASMSGWLSMAVPQMNVQGNSQLVNTSLVQNGVIDITSAADSLSLNNTQLTSDAAIASFTGAGALNLSTGASWTVNAQPPQSMVMPVGMTLNLNGGQLVNVENLYFPGTVNVNQPDFVENGSIVIPATTTFNYLASNDLQPNFDVINNGQFVVQSAASALNLNTAKIINNGSFSIISPTNMAVQSGFDNNGTLSLVNSASSLSVQTGAAFTNTGTIAGNGVLAIDGGTADFTAATLLPATLTLNLANAGVINNAQNLTIAGTFNWFDGILNGTGTAPLFTTQGVVNLQAGTLNTDWLIDSASVVNWVGSNAGDLIINNATITNQGEFHMAGIGASILSNGTTANKNFAGSTNASFINQGLLLLDGGTDTLVFDLNFDNVGGSIGILAGTFQIGSSPQDLVLDQTGERLFGSGTFNGSVINQSGEVSPGRFFSANTGSTGELTINGDYTQRAGGTLTIKMDSTVNGLQNDVLNVAGQLSADGAINFKLINGASVLQLAALIDQSFQPLKFNNFAGKFASSSVPAGLNFSLGEGGLITISSDNNLLNEVSNQIEVLFSKDDLDFDKVVRAMKFIDQKALVIAQTEDNEDDDEKKPGPRLVCK